MNRHSLRVPYVDPSSPRVLRAGLVDDRVSHYVIDISVKCKSNIHILDAFNAHRLPQSYRSAPSGY